MKRYPRHCVPFILLVGFVASPASGRDEPQGAQTVKNHPKYVYRSFEMSTSEPELSQKLGEYAIEGWRLASTYSGPNGKSVGIFERPYNEIEANELLTKLKGIRNLTYLEEAGNIKYSSGTKSPLTMSFPEGNRFTFTQPGLSQTGTIQYIRKEKKKLPNGAAIDYYLVDLLIENEQKTSAGKTTESSSFFTVRTLFIFEDPKNLTNIKFLSGGYTVDRPVFEQRQMSQKGPAPALSLYKHIPPLPK